MGDVNVNSPADQASTMAPPTHTDDQILPHIRWVPIGKNNCYMDIERSQSNPIYKISVDILKHTNFFRAFTASSIILSIYIQQFWDTVRYDKTVRCYKCQLDEQWFNLTKDTLRDAFQITPDNNNNAFSPPPYSNALINFLNDLGYPKVVRNLSNVMTNDMFQPWRALITIINLCLMGKTSGFERPRAQMLQILWGRKHKFHPRPDCPLHLPNEEPVLGYLKFSEPYYNEYLEEVAKHQRYLAGEKRSDPDSPAPKPAKATKKSKPSAPKADLRPLVTIQALSQQPKPKPAPTKSQGKKRKMVTKTSDKPSPARRSKPGLVTKRSKPTSSLRSVDESVDEGIPEKEPRFDDEEEGTRVWEISTTSRSLEKGKGKVTDEQVTLDLLTLQTSKKKSSADQFIFQRCTFTPTESSGHDESSSLYAELGLTESEARPNPGEQDEGQTGPNPSDAAASQPQSSLIVHAGPNLEHMDLEAMHENLKLTVEKQVILEEPASSTGTLSFLQHLAKYLSFGDLFFNDKPSEADNEKTTTKTKAESMVSVTIQQDTSSIPPMTTPIIDLTSRPDSLNVHRPLQAPATETTKTTHPPPPRPQQSTTDSMLMKCIDELEHIMANLIQDNKYLEDRLDSRGACLYTLENLDIPQQETNSYKAHEDHMMLYEALEKSMNHDHTDELLKDLAEAHNKKKKKRDSPKTPPGSPPHQLHPPPPQAGPSGTSRSPRASGSSQVPPPPPTPPSTNQEGQSYGSTTPSSLKIATSAKYKAWTTIDIKIRPSVSSTPEDLHMDDDMAPDAQANSSDDEDIENAHIPKVNLRQDWWNPLEEGRPATPDHAWSILSSNVPVPKNNWASAFVSTYSPPPEDSLLAQTVFHPNMINLQYQMEECHKLLTDSVDDSIIRHNVSKPLPLGGPSGQVTIQSDFFFNKDLEYLRYDSKGSRPALSISKMKATYYPDVGLEQMVPDQMWIEEECTHTSEGDRRVVRTHMRILSVVRIEVFSIADLNEHIIAKRDFKYLYPSDFEDLYLLNLQGHLNHLPPKDKKILTIVVNLWTRHLVIRQRVKDFQLGIESYQTQLNLTKPRWDATGFEYKHDYTVIDSPRSVTFWDKYEVQMIMWFSEIHKFSNSTLHQIDEALDYRVKEFKKRLKTRRIFRNLESFVGGRVRDEDYRLLKWQSAPASDHLKPKCTIKSRAKRSSKIILLGHYSIMLASSHNVKSKTDIKSPTHYPRGIARTSE
uniref:Monodehydroascorbate reductase n=1 Tax=Tanacetum cinerariifolium TaxID=118510 RepID=A0A6L2M251_TANCI|nr:hypothetical protein [Tanacetum cinerariifolium]